MLRGTRNTAFAWVLRMLFAFAISSYSFLMISKPFTNWNTFFNFRPETIYSREGKTMQIAFLKTPKTGSTTLACIFLNFGLAHNLTIYLPREFVVTEDMKDNLISQRKHYDIFVTHTVYNNYFFTQIVPSPVIIGLVRDPLQRIISQFFYNTELKDMFRLKGDSDNIFVHKIISNFTNYRRFLNGMAKSFGIKTDNNEIKEYLNILNKEFALVLILERFNESLVLLKRLLNWSFADIIYGKRKYNNYDIGSLNQSEYALLQSNNRQDIEVYHFFAHELNKKVIKAGKDFKEEVRYFEKILDEASEFCNNNPLHNARYIFPPSKWDGSFSVFADHCKMIFKFDDSVIKERLGLGFIKK